MKSSCKGLEVFDFKEEDELPEFADSRFSTKFGSTCDVLDKYNFFQNVAQESHLQSKEIGDILCVDKNGDSIVLYTSGDAREDSGFRDVPQNNSTIAELLPNFRPDKLELRSRFSSIEGSSGSGAVSPSKDWPLPPSSSSDESDAEESMSGRSPSKSFDIAEDEVPLDGPSSDHCFDGWEMDNDDMTVAFFPDYLVYHNRSCTNPVLIFSSSCIEVKGSTPCGNQGFFNFQWVIDDIMDIESQWSGKFGMAMIKIRVISKDALPAEDGHGVSAVGELTCVVVDPDWCDKQEQIISLDPKYKLTLNECYSFSEPFEEVVYPKGDPDAVSICKRDVDLLQPDTFVNDTIIDFYIKYLKDKIPPEDRHRFHFFNSFFFRKLADLDKDPSSASEGRAAFLRVRKWTRKVNLFEKDYVFIPVNFNSGIKSSCPLMTVITGVSLFYVILVKWPTMKANEDVQKSLKVPCILHMDSIKGSHTGLKGLVQRYLCEEWKERQKETDEDISSRFLSLRFVSLELPQQQNSFDCGLFLLHYAELFLEQAPINFNPFKITKISNFLNVDWFQPAEASLKRVLIQRLIYHLLENNSPEPSPAACSDKQCTSPRANSDTDTVVEFVSERCGQSRPSHGSILSSQTGQGIEMTLLPTSSLKSSQCLRELFIPEAAVHPFIDAEYHAFNESTPFDELKSAMSPVQEEGEGGQFAYSPVTETRLQQLDGITPEACAFPCSSKNFRAEASWSSGESNEQTAHEDICSSPETLPCASNNSLEVEVNGNSQDGGDLTLEEKVDRPRLPTESISGSTKCLASAPSEMLDADSQYPDDVLYGNADADPPTSSPKNLPGLPLRESDMQENGSVSCDKVQLDSDASESDSELQHVAKKMRLTPPLEGERLARSLPEDLHL
ncbi:hypothetical protein RJ640_023511 [Escallonia rubra]|uniref:Ubiquitin-like protease family profile domain-containing protein n=1 Tax=Escallonia rubra TaxID=112253 RepID=A0AA88QWX4_9ASTE|nr:hypothetical protein RJ640_023511 [Escallonia rubra]